MLPSMLQGSLNVETTTAVPVGVNRSLTSMEARSTVGRRLTPPRNSVHAVDMSRDPEGAHMTRYIVLVNVVVEATSEEEAALFVERAFAGRFDHDVIDVAEESPDER